MPTLDATDLAAIESIVVAARDLVQAQLATHPLECVGGTVADGAYLPLAIYNGSRYFAGPSHYLWRSSVSPSRYRISQIVGESVDYWQRTGGPTGTYAPYGACVGSPVVSGTVPSGDMLETLDDGSHRFSAQALALAPVGSPSVAVSVGAGQVTEGDFTVYQHGAFARPDGSAITFTITDEDGAAIDLSGKDLSLRCYHPGDRTAAFEFTTDDDLAIAGVAHNVVQLLADSTNSEQPGVFRYALWNLTDLVVVGRGRLLIPAEIAPEDQT